MVKISWEAPDNLIRDIIQNIKAGKDDAALRMLRILFEDAFQGGRDFQKRYKEEDDED